MTATHIHGMDSIKMLMRQLGVDFQASSTCVSGLFLLVHLNILILIVDLRKVPNWI